jgi:hypothetical protein
MAHLARILVLGIGIGLIFIIHAELTADHTRIKITTYPNATDPGAIPGAQSFQTSAPFYPSPWMTGAGDWASAYEQAKAFVSQLTLLEKVNLTTGVG